MHLFSVRQRRVTALTFLVMFLNVFVGQLICVGMDRSPAAHSHAPGTPAHEHTPRHPAGPVAHRHAPGTAQHQHKSHQHKLPTSKSNCCSDDAASVMASLAHPTKFSLEKPAGNWVVALLMSGVLIPRFTHWDRTQAVVLVRPECLKPKIPDIRIFIGSLTI